MRDMTRATIALLMSRVAFAVVTAASTSPPVSQTPPSATSGVAQDPFPNTDGRTALLRVCGNCHTAETVIQTMRTRQEWSEVIDQMARFGAEANDQEFEQILTYLAKHFSPIKINKATAKDLEATLDVPAKVAEAIVAYRLEKGEFKTIDELRKIPGLDSVTIETRKARVVF